MSKRAEEAVIASLARSPLGTYEETVAKHFDLPLAEVEAAVAAMLKRKHLIRVKTGVLFVSAKYGKDLLA